MERELPKLQDNTADLPVSQIESLKFKATQIHASIDALRQTVQMNGMPYMPPWPDILSKYNLLISQTTNFHVALSQSLTRTNSSNFEDGGMLFETIALHPKKVMTDLELDTQIIPLLRNQQTTDVLKDETETVRILAERLHTKGSIGLLGSAPNKPEHGDVLAECEEIRAQHDSRVERAFRAVNMLRDKYQWRNWTSVVAEEEPEELKWDSRSSGDRSGPEDEDMEDVDGEDDDDDDDGDRDGEEDDDGDGDEVEDTLQRPPSSNPATPMAV